MSYPGINLDGTDLSDKSTQELRDYRVYLIKVKTEILGQYRDTELEQLQSDVDDRMMDIVTELRDREQ